MDGLNQPHLGQMYSVRWQSAELVDRIEQKLPTGILPLVFLHESVMCITLLANESELALLGIGTILFAQYRIDHSVVPLLLVRRVGQWWRNLS